MRRTIALGTLLITMPLFTFADECVDLTERLSYGSTGAEVLALQTFFHQTYSTFSAESITGYFGPTTHATLQRWQAENGIASSGDAATTGWGATGPLTRAALACTGEAAAASDESATVLDRTLSQGAHGDDVGLMQQILISLGHLAPDAATGYFGSLTRAALEAFQREQGIVSSGSAETTGYGAAGPRTRAALISAGAAGEFVSSSNSSASEAELDQTLREIDAQIETLTQDAALPDDPDIEI